MLRDSRAYINRSGDIVTVKRMVIHAPGEPEFIDSLGREYDRNGRYMHREPHPMDLIQEVKK